MQRLKLALSLNEIAAVTLLLAACSAESISERLRPQAGTRTPAHRAAAAHKQAYRCVTAMMGSVVARNCATPMGPSRSAAVRRSRSSLAKRAETRRLFQSCPEYRPKHRPTDRFARSFKET